MKVLLGVDGSSNSLATVTFVGRLLSPDHDQLVLAFVAPPLPPLGDDQLDPKVAARAQGALSSAVFDEAELRLTEAWQAQVQRLELVGGAGASLLAAADKQQADMIAVGFRGTGLFERFLLGSVSRAIVHSSHVPVLVVKTAEGPESEKLAGVADGTFRVLAATDGLEFGERIAATTGRLTWPAASRGWVMTAVPPMFAHHLPSWMRPAERDPDVQAMAEAWQREYDQQLEVAVARLAEFQQTMPAIFQGTEPIVAQGLPAEQILATVVRQKIDMVVVGGRGHGTIERLLIGSTSARVVNEAACSVLIAR